MHRSTAEETNIHSTPLFVLFLFTDDDDDDKEDDNDGVDVDDDDDVGDEDDVEDDARTICSGGCGVAALGGRQLGEAFLPPAAAADQSQTCESKRKVGRPPT